MSMPKAELHVHLEGAAPPRLIKRLAKKHGLTLPEDMIDEKHDRFISNDFLHFLKVYDQASAAIRTKEDYREVTYEYLKQSAEQGVIYAELTSSPDHAAQNNLSYEDHVSGIAQGIDDARHDFGIEGRIIIAFVRHFGVEKAETLARTIIAHPHPYVVGVGLGGDEAGFPPKLFATAFQIAKDAGLGCTAHAGEMVGPEGVWEALTYLPISRLGHGVRSIEDPALLEEIKKRNITLECCPTSNIFLKVYPSLGSHPLRALLNAGVKVTISSDDPPYFGTTVGHEYFLAKTVMKFSDIELLEMTRNSIEASFADEETKKQLLGKLIHG